MKDSYLETAGSAVVWDRGRGIARLVGPWCPDSDPAVVRRRPAGSRGVWFRRTITGGERRRYAARPTHYTPFVSFVLFVVKE